MTQVSGSDSRPCLEDLDLPLGKRVRLRDIVGSSYRSGPGTRSDRFFPQPTFSVSRFSMAISFRGEL